MEKLNNQQVMAVTLILKICNISIPFGLRAGSFLPCYEKSMSLTSDAEKNISYFFSGLYLALNSCGF